VIRTEMANGGRKTAVKRRTLRICSVGALGWQCFCPVLYTVPSVYQFDPKVIAAL
jgi:hypothetical protein